MTIDLMSLKLAMNSQRGRLRVQQSSSVRFAVGVTLFGMLLRAIPEIWAGGNLIGFDTVFYAGEMSRLNSCIRLFLLPSEFTLGVIACPLTMIMGPFSR